MSLRAAFLRAPPAGLDRPPVALARLRRALAGCLASLGRPWAAGDEPQIGRPAPDFTATDSDGKVRRLADFRGKTVVLEWTNAECPYTRKHYSSGNMQNLQELARQRGVIWLR